MKPCCDILSVIFFSIKDEEKPDEFDLQVQYPVLEQLGEEKEQVLKNLEIRLEEDINKLVSGCLSCI